jgi:membrane-associated phospholipid phosphatase
VSNPWQLWGVTAKFHWREGWIVWRLGWARLWPRWWVILAIVGLGVAAVLLFGEADDLWLNRIRVPDNPQLKHIAGRISFWGDLTWNIPLSLLLWGAGAIFKRARWRKLGWACLLAGLMGGMVLNVFRCTLGRPRPSAGLPDGFYGPHLKSAYHGFPSGHTTVSFATTTSVMTSTPVLGVPCLLYASTVGWSRMQLNRHHPFDVATGAALGGFIGICFGSAVPGARWRLRRRRKLQTNPRR